MELPSILRHYFIIFGSLFWAVELCCIDKFNTADVFEWTQNRHTFETCKQSHILTYKLAEPGQQHQTKHLLTSACLSPSEGVFVRLCSLAYGRKIDKLSLCVQLFVHLVC